MVAFKFEFQSFVLIKSTLYPKVTNHKSGLAREPVMGNLLVVPACAVSIVNSARNGALGPSGAGEGRGGADATHWWPAVRRMPSQRGSGSRHTLKRRAQSVPAIKLKSSSNINF